ncbi:alpha/beta-hydrolase [Aspergillus californicus]
MSNLPSLVLIHGSWHTPACWDPILAILKSKHNLNCTAVTLPSNTNNPAATLKDDIDAAQSAVSAEVSRGRDVVIIAHSYGGMVGNSCIKGFARPSPPQSTDKTQLQSSSPATLTRTETDKGHVIGLILIASGFTLTGYAFMDLFFGMELPFFRANRETGFAELRTPLGPKQLFYHDLPDPEAEYWVSQLTTQSLKALFEGSEHAYAGWKDVPTWYIGTSEDKSMPVAVQRISVGVAKGMGGEIEHRELPTSHSPFLSLPGETVGVVVEAVEAFTGASIVSQDSAEQQRDWVTRRSDVVTVPGARLLRPLTWISFGLPLAFGRFVGCGIWFFARGRRAWRSRFGLRSA